MESVGLVLQCCIGGRALGFNVIQLGPRNFRFSVASNKVGHFIYALKDHIWPNFICHFCLYKANVDYSYDSGSWHLDLEVPEIVARKPMAIKSSLDFLHVSAQKDHSSARELAKFGLRKDTLAPRILNFEDDHLNIVVAKNDADSILSFDVFNCNLSSIHDRVDKSTFLGMDFKHNYWK